MDETTEGSLLGGRLRYRQFRHGFRTGIEPVLLAAAVPARAGQRVLEAGCGAGAATLCLFARVAGLRGGIGIEADPGTAALAQHNWEMNGFSGLAAMQGSLPDLPRGIGQFDHAFANPPWHRRRGSATPVPRRDVARRAAAGLLEAWIVALAAPLKPGGTLTLILPAGLYAEAGGIMQREARLGGIRLLPFWPRAGVPAKIVLLQGRRGSRADAALLAGLVLHQPDGRFTEATERILREGEPLPLAAVSVRASGSRSSPAPDPDPVRRPGLV